MNEYKEQLNKVAFSEETYEKITSIGDRYYLLIDQMGELAAEIRDIITGATPSSKFIAELKSRLEISEQTATKIATDVSNEIFMDIKEALQKIQEEAEKASPSAPQTPPSTPKPDIAPIEKAGDFSVINRPPSASPIYNDSNLKRENVLHDLENIEKLKPENAHNYVEHLLTGTVQKPAPTPPPIQPVTPPIQRKPGPDPYREQV